jgi:hypothetical protein
MPKSGNAVVTMEQVSRPIWCKSCNRSMPMNVAPIQGNRESCLLRANSRKMHKKPFHGDNIGSNPIGDTNKNHHPDDGSMQEQPPALTSSDEISETGH